MNGLNFELAPGDRVGLVGPNGSGKTTMCRIIMGLLKADSGGVEVFGKLMKQESDFARIRGRIGYLFQDSDDQLFCPTVLEDIAFGPLNQGKTPKEAKRIVESTLQLLKLNGIAERFTHQLSGGEKRLVSLASVMAMEPEVLLLDEPTTGLDEETTETLVTVLTKSDLTYVTVSHDTDFLERISNKILIMKGGELQPV
ncbi:energy-coupling factor ABC transporter ATP-binding protein [Thermodesulfobacteriota bacterium]